MDDEYPFGNSSNMTRKSSVNMEPGPGYYLKKMQISVDSNLPVT